MNNIDYSAYAALLIDAGLNFRPGMSLTIGTGYDGYPLARLCAQTAYARGARMVEIRWNDEHILRSRIENQTGNDENLRAVPGWIDAWQRTLVDEKWAYLALKSREDEGLLA